jgi:hypothetical protein
MLSRALGALDLLLFGSEQAGYSVSSTEGPATLVVEGERVPFSIVEEIGRKSTAPSGRLTIVLGEMYSGGQRLWTDRAFHPVESRIADIVAEARVHAEVLRNRRERREEGAEVRRADESERMQRRKRITFLMERADDLDQAVKVSRLIEHIRNTDNGSSPRLRGILKWADGYVAELREASSSTAIDRGAAEWGIW